MDKYIMSVWPDRDRIGVARPLRKMSHHHGDVDSSRPFCPPTKSHPSRGKARLVVVASDFSHTPRNTYPRYESWRGTVKSI